MKRALKQKFKLKDNVLQDLYATINKKDKNKRMKHIVKILMIIIVISTLLSSCQMDVSLEPKFTPTTTTTEGQLIYQLAGIYTKLTNDQTYGYGFYGYINGGADECFRHSSNTSQVFMELYNNNSSDDKIATLWRGLYQGIERANIFLDVIDQPQIDSLKREDYCGQAIFLRAYYHYLLVSMFGDVPLKTKLSSDMGTDFNLPRTPSKDVYNFIISEMAKAEGMVQTMDKVGNTSMVTKTAIQGILARVCLSMAGNPVKDVEKFKDAKFWAQKVIDSNLHSLNTSTVSFPNFQTTPAYSKLFINNMQNVIEVVAGNNEGIWDATFLSKSNTSGNYAGVGFMAQQLGSIMGVYCPTATPNGIIGYSGGIYRVFPKLYNLFGPGDLRRDWVVAPYLYKDATTTKYNSLTVNITGGGGSGATATAYTSATGAITSVVVNNPGTAYTSVPTITFTGYSTGTSISTTGSGAAATAVVAGGKITTINVTNGGSKYPTVYDRCVGKWRREYEINLPPVREKNYTSCNFPIIRYADVLLMFAEADLMINGTPSPTALEYYNQVRRRAYGYTNITNPVPGFDVATFTFQNIVDERARELCFEGLRRADLIRWGIMTNVMESLKSYNIINAPTAYSVTSTAAASNYLSNPTKYALLPIPQLELTYDKALMQNPGW
jgi:hypothetical protein